MKSGTIHDYSIRDIAVHAKRGCMLPLTVPSAMAAACLDAATELLLDMVLIPTYQQCILTYWASSTVPTSQ